MQALKAKILKKNTSRYNGFSLFCIDINELLYATHLLMLLFCLWLKSAFNSNKSIEYENGRRGENNFLINTTKFIDIIVYLLLNIQNR